MSQNATYRLGIESPVGWWTITTDDAHVFSVDYAGNALPPGMRVKPETRLEQRLACMMQRYFRGERVRFEQIPVLIPEKPLMLASVMRILRAIPAGSLQSYQWIADRLGNANAARAAGGALGRNPVPIIVPCHRVIAKNGDLGGFMRGHPSGRRIKTFLLELEGHQVIGDFVSPESLQNDKNRAVI